MCVCSRLTDNAARDYYEHEALRGGWSVRDLDRQIGTKAYQRLRGLGCFILGAASIPKEHIRDSFVLEFLNLKDEYSESDLEQALILDLERFLLELGNDFAFVARQKRLRIGTEWYRVDLLFFHRRLRSLLIVELKVGKFTHADAGQMNLYLNYARKYWVNPDENPPVGLILCSERGAAVAHYSLESLRNTVVAREYELALPDEHRLAERLALTRNRLLSSRTERG
jgi:predicted nuclease of restriction endonuclease-like (RecB) superfamily